MSRFKLRITASTLASIHLALLAFFMGTIAYMDLFDSGWNIETVFFSVTLLAITASAAFSWWFARRLDKTAAQHVYAPAGLTLDALATVDARPRMILDNLNDGILLATEQGCILSANAGAVKILGAENSSSLVGKSLHEFIGNDWSLSPEIGNVTKVGYRSNLAPFTLEYTVRPIVLDGEACIVTVIRDTTQQRITQDELAKHREKLEELVRQRTEDLARARDQAVEASRAKSAFLANMSHELRTPLNAVIGYSEMIAEDARINGHTRYLEDARRICTSGQHLLQLINDVLDLSKIESGKMELHLEKFDLRTVLNEVALQIRPMIDKNQNRLELILDSNLSIMEADLTKIRQIVSNLLSNSAKFTEAGTITLRAQCIQHYGLDWVLLSVTDTGIGMTEQQMKHLFVEFTQGDSSTTRKYGGTGLGLAITRRFCEMMGGQIQVSSSQSKGSTFTVQLPSAVIGPKIDPRQIRFSPDPDGHYKRRQKISRVLVIDDDPFARDLLERFLTREGFFADVATDGKTGLVLAREHKPDVIVLDVKMPDMDGWSVLSKLKSEASLANIPVVMLTMSDNQELSLALGAADFLPKPIERQRLLDVLLRHVRGHSDSRPRSHVLIVEDDPVNRDLLRNLLQREELTVSTANNGREALLIMQTKLPDIIFLDLLMPVMDGFQFLAEMQRNPAWIGIPVVTLTAVDLSKEQKDQLHGQVEVLLDKRELNPIELLQKLREVVVHFVRSPVTQSQTTAKQHPEGR